jgi:hypothetical protein
MKKLFFILFVSVLYSACTGNKSDTATGTDSSSLATAAESESAVSLPYTAGYSSDFSLGKNSTLVNVLNSYKAWETGDMTALKNTFADSITFVFSNGFTFTGTADGFATESKKYRDSLSSVKLYVDAWMPVHSNDKNEDWVLVWYKEIDTYKTGKIDSAYYHDDNMIDKNGKIAFTAVHRQSYMKN